MRTIPKQAINLIKQFEGFSATPYLCQAGILTIGYGTTVINGVSVKDSGITYITVQQAEQFLANDCKQFVAAIERNIKVQLTDNQFSALLSFVYNLGEGGLKNKDGKPTGICKKINAGDFVGASTEFLKWTKAGGKVSNGLVRRRQAEAKLFQS